MGHLTNDDREWLDVKFSEVHEKVNVQVTDLAGLKQSFLAHVSAPCPNRVGHEESHHVVGIGKLMGFIGAAVGIVGGIVAILVLFWK